MKTAPGAFTDVVGTSHPVNTKAELRQADDTVVADLPVEAGTVTASAGYGINRWNGSLTLAGTEWAPLTPSDPLSPLSGHYVSIQRGVQPYGDAEAWVELCRLWPTDTTVTMSRREARLDVTLDSAGYLAAQAGGLVYKPQPGETCQAMVARIISQHLPYTPTVVDTSTATPVPSNFEPDESPLYTVVDELMSLADARVYFDALGRLVMRPALPSLDIATLAPGRQLSIHLDVTRYTLQLSRSRFYNDVIVRYRGTDDRLDDTEGKAHITSGPLARDGVAGRSTFTMDLNITATQAQADAFARSVLTAQQQAWALATIDAVQDPRIEPDDVVEAEYLDRTLRHRVISVRFDLRTDAMTLTARTQLPGS